MRLVHLISFLLAFKVNPPTDLVMTVNSFTTTRRHYPVSISQTVKFDPRRTRTKRSPQRSHRGAHGYRRSQQPTNQVQMRIRAMNTFVAKCQREGMLENPWYNMLDPNIPENIASSKKAVKIILAMDRAFAIRTRKITDPLYLEVVRLLKFPIFCPIARTIMQHSTTTTTSAGP